MVYAEFATLEPRTDRLEINEAALSIYAGVKQLEAELADAHQVTGQKALRLLAVAKQIETAAGNLRGELER